MASAMPSVKDRIFSMDPRTSSRYARGSRMEHLLPVRVELSVEVNVPVRPGHQDVHVAAEDLLQAPLQLEVGEEGVEAETAVEGDFDVDVALTGAEVFSACG